MQRTTHDDNTAAERAAPPPAAIPSTIVLDLLRSLLEEHHFVTFDRIQDLVAGLPPPAEGGRPVTRPR